VALLVAAGALAASRPRYGGVVRVAVAGPLPDADPLLADAPAEAAVSSLFRRAVCRLDRSSRVVPEVALELTRPAAGELHVSLRPALQTSQGARVGAGELAASWARAFAPETASPYRALLAPVRGEGKGLASAATSPYGLDVPLAYAWPDLEKSLCHPALALVVPGPKGLSGIGPFEPGRGTGAFTFNVHAPLGRPYLDRLSVLATDERGAVREFAELKHAEVALAAPAATPVEPMLYATYLVFRPERVPATFRQSVQSTVDPADLTRFFVRAPAAPLWHLMPPALMPAEPTAAPARPAAEPRELVLLYDGGLEDQHLVAERVQIRLHDLGYRIQLRALPRAALRARWASGDFDALFQSVLLPPVPAAAFAVVLDVAGRHDLLSAELPPLGALADASQRDAKVRERALALEPSLPAIPLYVQGLSVQASPRLEGLSTDAFGLPTLDDVFLAE
jgi:peptide/nickel transport system substrate-binding protein